MVEDTGRATRRNWIALAISGPRLRCIVQRYVPEYIAFVEQQVAEAGLADTNSVLKHSFEHWLKLAGRARNDLQHVGGGGLLLERFAQFVQQPRVLDGDDSLASKAFEECDLLVRERTDLLAIDSDDTDALIFLEHRYRKHRT